MKSVLIIGETFHKESGGGITLSNLFKNWPAEKLAVATTPKSILKSDFKKCSNYYMLGKEEDDSCFLFKKLIDKSTSGKVSEKANQQNFNLLKTKSKSELLKRYAKNIFYSFIEKLGLNFSCERYKISEKFINWVEEFNPDFIYTQLSTLQLIQFTNDLYKFKNRKLIIHIMDDWPKTITERCWLRKKYWDKTIESKFQTVLESSYKLLTISEGMKEEYQKRYGKTSDVFHNPVEVEYWLPFEQYLIPKNSELIKILYTGRIGKANSKSIFLLIKAIDIIRNQLGRCIELHIFSSDSLNVDIKTKEFVHIKQSVPHSAMPELLQNSDFLFLPLDFDKRSIQFAKLSMPTKATEYMISGTPVLLFAPQETYLYQHAVKNNWAKVVGEFSLNALIKAITTLIDNMELRMNYASSAKDYAIKNYDLKIVNRRFEEIFSS